MVKKSPNRFQRALAGLGMRRHPFAAFLTAEPRVCRPRTTDPIKVGILHSLSGTMAISETSLKDVVADDSSTSINAKGGVLGQVSSRRWSSIPASNWPLFAEKARELIARPRCGRGLRLLDLGVPQKSVLPVFEELNGLLFYPVQYEGEESSYGMSSTPGAAPNQQAIPAVEYLMDEENGGGAKKLGAPRDRLRVSPHHEQDPPLLPERPMAWPKDSDIMEEYTPFGHSDYQTIVANIKKFAAGKPDGGGLHHQR